MLFKSLDSDFIMFFILLSIRLRHKISRQIIVIRKVPLEDLITRKAIGELIFMNDRYYS